MTRWRLLAAAALLVPAAAPAAERVSIDRDWRFTMGDPADAAGRLVYDPRPAVAADGWTLPAEAPGPGAPVLKPWVMPSGNAFIADPAKRFARPAGDPGADVSYVRPGFDDSGWQHVDLPHDWAIKGPFLKEGPYGGMGRLPSWGIGWYRRALTVPRADAGKSVFLDVDGAMAYSAVWLNGHFVGGWPNGYTSWRLDLTPYVQPGGRNELVIRLDNPPASSRWYPGGGLYRHVWLTTASKLHVGHWGTQLTTPRVSPQAATIALAVTLDNDGAAPAAATIATQIFAADDDGHPGGRAVLSLPPQRLTVAARASGVATASAVLANPKLWGPPPAQQPNRYVAVTTVTAAGRTVDRHETPFGIRSIRYAADGLYVNDQRIELKGSNNHHDLGAIGAAFNVHAAERELTILREMGDNALRMSHNPPAPELLDLADRMGFLVLDEQFDSWALKKTPLDFHLTFPDWHEQDLRAMIRRDRNHPSVFLWSIGNEVGEQTTGEAGAAIGRELVAIAHQEDASRGTTSAMNAATPAMLLPGIVDTIGLNYQGAGVRTKPGQFPAFRAAFPTKMIFSTESEAAYSSRGAYQFPVVGAISAPVRPDIGGDGKQVSAYELYAADFGSTADRAWAAQDQNPYVAGEFVWTGFDYLGEPDPYATSRSSYFGIVDLAGFKKDRFWLYQSRWRPDLPMAHILPHWTWPGREGKVTPVHVFTSADEAELFVNGVSQGRKKRGPYEYRFRWDYVTYQPGELRVETWKNGKPWASDTVKTAGAAAMLDVTADRSAIAADGSDLAYVSVRIADGVGTTVPDAHPAIRFTVSGPGELVATDNGDPTDFTSFASAGREAFHGRALAIVRSRPGQRGTIRVTASVEGLPAGSVAVTSGAAARR